MNATLMRWALVPVVLLALMLCATHAEAQKGKGNFTGKKGGNFGGQPNNNFGGQPNNNFGGQPNNNFGGQPNNNFGGQPNNHFGGQPNNDLGGQPNPPNWDQGFNGGMPSRPGSNADAEKAARTVTGGMMAMGVLSFLTALVIFGCLGFLIIRSGVHSAPSNSPRRRSRR